MAGMSRVFSSGEQDPSDLNADRISNLPWNVLDIILGKLSITEAVRTSVLAKDWRYSWLTMSKFSLSSEEIGEVLDFRDPRWDILSSIVSNFLLHHTTTSIMTFILQSFFCSHFSDLSNWIEFLSKKGVEVLELIEFGDQYLKMPTHLFSFEKLKVLVIESFSLQIPSSFRSFKFLEELSLNEVSISSGDLYRLILACPLLLNLTLVTISGIQNLRIHSARLTMLEVDTGFVGIDVEFAPCLSTVSIINDYRSFTPQSVPMVHELIGIQDNKVDLRTFGKVPKDQQEVVLSSEQDSFFKANMYENFGDIGMNIKRMVDEFQQIAKSNQKIQTIEDMAKFVDNYPEYRRKQGNVSKHVTLVTEMSKIVEERKLMLVSQTEQELACNGGQGAAFEAVTTLLNNENVSDIDRLRLVMLYALRYEKESPVQLMQLFNKLASKSAKYKPGLVQFLLKQAGVDKRTGDLFGNRDLLNIARNMARGLKGVENVYTQHQPLLTQTMESISKGRLRDIDYPYVGNHFQPGRPLDVVIFIVGGTTYEESRSISLFNSTNSGIRFILGGTTILNSKRFLKDLEDAQRMIRSSSTVV